MDASHPSRFSKERTFVNVTLSMAATVCADIKEQSRLIDKYLSENSIKFKHLKQNNSVTI